MTSGFATKDANGVDLRTVSPTARATKVNWLAGVGIRVTNAWSEEAINEAFDKIAPQLGASLVCVKVNEEAA